MELLSVIAGITSILVGIYAIWFAQRESRNSADNHKLTKELLSEIQVKIGIIDRAIQFEQAQLVAIINKALDSMGQERITYEYIPLEEINRLISENIEPTNKQLKEVTDYLRQAPKIHTGPNPPANAKDGDIWIST